MQEETLSRTLFSEPMKEHTKEQTEEVFLSGKNRVGAAWSAYLMLVYHTLAARKPALLSLASFPFPDSPKCPGERGGRRFHSLFICFRRENHEVFSFVDESLSVPLL
jgi:hypothetical protein